MKQMQKMREQDVGNQELIIQLIERMANANGALNSAERSRKDGLPFEANVLSKKDLLAPFRK